MEGAIKYKNIVTSAYYNNILTKLKRENQLNRSLLFGSSTASDGLQMAYNKIIYMNIRMKNLLKEDLIVKL